MLEAQGLAVPIAAGRVLLLAAAGAALLAGCHRRESPAEAGIATQTLLVGNAAEPADLDPQVIYAWTDQNIDNALFEGLTWIDERTTRPIPAAARSWDESPDGLVYTFHLRPNGRWSNGDPVTAGDFVYAFHRILTPTFGAFYSYMLWPIRNARAYNLGRITDFSRVGVKALDPLTLRVTLERPTPYLPALAAHATWMPLRRATIEKFGRFDQRGTRWTRPGNLVGNGAFVLKTWIPNGRIVVERNPWYWNAARVRLRRIVYYPIESSDTEEFAFLSGQLQVTHGLPINRIAAYRRDHPELLRIDPILASFYLFVNVHRPPLDRVLLRRALSLAIDRRAIAQDVLLGSRRPAFAMTPPDCGGYSPRAAVPDDPAAARRLLAEAGFPGGRGLLVFNVLSYQSTESLLILQAVQAEWARELGVQVTITPQEQKTLFQNQRDHNYAIAFSGWIADYPDPSTFLDTMVTGNGNNYAGWSDPDYDRWIAAAESTAAPAPRFEDFQRAEAILIREAPILPLFYDTAVYLKQPYVRGWTASQLDFHRFSDVWLRR